MVRRFAYSAPFFQVPSPGQGWDFFAVPGGRRRLAARGALRAPRAAKRKSGSRRLASGSRFSARFARPPPPLGTQRNRTRRDKRVKAGLCRPGEHERNQKKKLTFLYGQIPIQGGYLRV